VNSVFAKAENKSTVKPSLPHTTNSKPPPAKLKQTGELRTRLLNMILENEQQRRSDFVARPPTPK